MKCDRCDVESAREEFFRVVPRPFSKRTLRLCPSCAAKHGDKEYSQAAWFIAGLCGTAIILAWLAPDNNAGPLIWNLGLLLVFVIGSTVVHELGHVFVGRLAGMHISGIEIGRGRLVFDFRLWGFRWQFRAVPIGGFAHGGPKGGAWVRLRQTLFVLGGPLANVLLIGVALALTGLSAPSDFMERFNPGQMLLMTNAVFALSSMVPCTMDTSHGKLPSDGLLLWRIWRQSRAHIDATVPYWCAVEAQELMDQRKNDQATVVLWEGLKEYPDDISLEQVRANSLLSQGKAAEARRIFSKILGRYSKFEHVRYTMFNNIAWADVLLGDPALMWEADAGSRLAVEAQPWSAAFKGTRGSVLVELGELDAGLGLLNEAFRENEDVQNKALNACFIGIAHARRGDAEQGRSYFALARRLDPDCVLLQREPKVSASEKRPS